MSGATDVGGVIRPIIPASGTDKSGLSETSGGTAASAAGVYGGGALETVQGASPPPSLRDDGANATRPKLAEPLRLDQSDGGFAGALAGLQKLLLESGLLTREAARLERQSHRETEMSLLLGAAADTRTQAVLSMVASGISGAFAMYGGISQVRSSASAWSKIKTAEVAPLDGPMKGVMERKGAGLEEMGTSLESQRANLKTETDLIASEQKGLDTAKLELDRAALNAKKAELSKLEAQQNPANEAKVRELDRQIELKDAEIARKTEAVADENLFDSTSSPAEDLAKLKIDKQALVEQRAIAERDRAAGGNADVRDRLSKEIAEAETAIAKRTQELGAVEPDPRNEIGSGSIEDFAATLASRESSLKARIDTHKQNQLDFAATEKHLQSRQDDFVTDGHRLKEEQFQKASRKIQLESERSSGWATIVTEGGKGLAVVGNLFAGRKEADKAEKSAEASNARNRADELTDFMQSNRDVVRAILDRMASAQQAEGEVNRQIGRA